MIYGIGTDIVQISRIQDALTNSGERFAEKILGPDELVIYHQRKAQVPARGLRYLATRFAAKEAFSKAIGMGMRHPMNWHAMQTLSEESGQPVIITNGHLQQWMQERNLLPRVSISDESSHVIALVIVEKISADSLHHD